ncbi:hypothetical protein SO802_026709 [Lithocarpus litseifolius]|uniref:Uncharacterized protein n=1 Tax=Lithocarpus litseifolius TaxID=425828 RepID=A0AAW2C3L9_9ROSI
MTVFSGKQVFLVDYEARVLQRLLEASLSSDLKSTLELIANQSVNVNFVGAVCLKSRKTEVIHAMNRRVRSGLCGGSVVLGGWDVVNTEYGFSKSEFGFVQWNLWLC